MTDGESHYRKYTDDNLGDEAGSSSRTEMMRRLKEAIQKSGESSNELGQRIWWLNLWLLVFTIVIGLLTAAQVYIAVQSTKWTNTPAFSGSAWVLWYERLHTEKTGSSPISLSWNLVNANATQSRCETALQKKT